MIVPDRLAETCSKTPERSAWLGRLREVIPDLEGRWRLTLSRPFDGPEVSCAWVAPATLTDGTSAVIKIGMPHFEGEQEIAALRFLDGNPTVRLLHADDDLNAMLLERCVPGTVLRNLRPESEQDVVIAQLLRRFWREPVSPYTFRPLAELTAYWSAATIGDAERWPDPELVAQGLRLFQELPLTASASVLLATDLHAGNVLEAQRQPWLVIDPKPFVGDPAYDATQHLLNCRGRMRSDPRGTIARFADLLDVDAERVRLWMFARYAAEPRDAWGGESLALARRLL